MNVAGHQIFFAQHPADANWRPHLVMIHGAGGSHLDWPVDLRRLPRTSVMIPDLPGHGRSRGTSLSSIDAYATVVEQWLDALSLENAVLLGHSMGGAIVLTIALRRSPPISGIIILASGARLRVSHAILKGLDEDFPAVIDALLTGYWGPEAPPDALAASRKRLQSAGRDLLRADFRVTNEFDVMSRLDKIQTPALVIGGERDRLTPPKYARYLAQKMPDAELLIVPGTHHMLHHQQPAVVAQAVSRFLDSLA